MQDRKPGRRPYRNVCDKRDTVSSIISRRLIKRAQHVVPYEGARIADDSANSADSDDVRSAEAADPGLSVTNPYDANLSIAQNGMER
jgi:hypothetical protein